LFPERLRKGVAMKFLHRNKRHISAPPKPLGGQVPGGFAGHTWAVNEWNGKNHSLIMGADRGSFDARDHAAGGAAAPAASPVGEDREPSAVRVRQQPAAY
jgi:hypothetical protein